MEITLSVATQSTNDGEDWGYMLARMYKCWAIRQEYVAVAKTEHADGRATHTLTIVGLPDKAVEVLREEAGVHRLVRTSPFDSQGRRCTVFAAVAVDHADVSWKDQRRSYVLHPYEQVTDHKTGVKVPAPHAVLDGHLDEFLVIE